MIKESKVFGRKEVVQAIRQKGVTKILRATYHYLGNPPKLKGD